MTEQTEKQLQQRVATLEKTVQALVNRVLKLEAEARRTKSAMSRTSIDVKQLQLARRG